MDLVYALGTGSNWNNNELRFSLRSVAKNLKGYGHIYIVGENPGFITGTGITHIPYPDEYHGNADGNIIRKVLRACQIKELSDDFIFMNDDNYFNKPMHVADIYPFHKGNMNQIDPNVFKGVWGIRLGNTRAVLGAKKIVPLHFDHHAPILFNKQKFTELYPLFDYASLPGLTIKSVYGSVHYPKAPVMNGEKVAIFKQYKLADIKIFLQNALYVANNDLGLNHSFKYWLVMNFPVPSPWESGNVNDKTIQIATWKHRGERYDEGVDIFLEHFKNKKNLCDIVRVHKSALTVRKIKYFLNQHLKEL